MERTGARRIIALVSCTFQPEYIWSCTYPGDALSKQCARRYFHILGSPVQHIRTDEEDSTMCRTVKTKKSEEERRKKFMHVRRIFLNQIKVLGKGEDIWGSVA